MVLIGSDGREQDAKHVIEIRVDHLQLGSTNRHTVAEIVDHRDRQADRLAADPFREMICRLGLART